MRTIESLSQIQRDAERSLNRRGLPHVLRRAGLTGSISGGVRRHADTAKVTLIAGGLLVAVITGVALAYSNIGGEQGLKDRTSQFVYMVNR